MRQLCRIHRAISVCLFLGGVSAFKVQHSQTPETHQQPPRDATSGGLSPNKWGLKAISWYQQPESDQPPSFLTPAPLRPNDFLALSSSATTSGSNTLLLTTALLWVLVTICLVVILSGGSENESGEEPPEAPVSPSYSFSPRITCNLPVDIIDAYSPSLEVDGPARNSQASPEQSKDALELCLRCEIFSAHEYSNNRISQEHVDECLWIANTMLQQMSLDAWVDLSESDRQSFEDSVDAILQAMPPPPAFGTLDVRATAPVSKGKKGSPTTSSVSLGSEVSFKIAREPDEQAPDSNYVGQYVAAVMTVTQTPLMDPEWAHLQDTRPLPEKLPARSQDTRPLPEKTPVPDASPGTATADKSPVPLMNCGDEAEVYTPPSSSTSTELPMEGVFSSIFGGSSAAASPQASHLPSPLESARVPSSGFSVPSTAFSTVPNSPYVPNSSSEKVPLVRLSPQEVMAPPPDRVESPGSGRLLEYDNCSPRGLLGSMSAPSGIGSFSPRGIMASQSATSIRESRPGSSSTSSRTQLLSETPDLTQNQRLPGRDPRLS